MNLGTIKTRLIDELTSIKLMVSWPCGQRSSACTRLGVLYVDMKVYFAIPSLLVSIEMLVTDLFRHAPPFPRIVRGKEKVGRTVAINIWRGVNRLNRFAPTYWCVRTILHVQLSRVAIICCALRMLLVAAQQERCTPAIEDCNIRSERRGCRDVEHGQSRPAHSPGHKPART